MKVQNLNKIIIISIIFAASGIISIIKPQSDKNVYEKRTYTIGYMKNLFNEVDLSDAQAAMKVWVNEIVKTYHYENGYNLRAKIYYQIDEVNKEQKEDSLAILGLNTFDYLSNNSRIGLDPVLVPSAEGDIYGEYYILVRKESHYKNIKDLKGTNIGIMSGTNQIASRFWLDVTLAKYNIPEKSKFFKNLFIEEKESQLILNLFFGHLDACIVSAGSFSLMKELNPQVGENLVSIESSPKYLWGVLCFTKTFTNERDRNLFYTNAVHVHELVSGKQLLSLIKIDKLLPFKAEYLNSFKNLMKEYTYLLKTKKIKDNEPN
jgi:phosphonate transport system substrate-binding protein